MPNQATFRAGQLITTGMAHELGCLPSFLQLMPVRQTHTQRKALSRDDKHEQRAEKLYTDEWKQTVHSALTCLSGRKVASLRFLSCGANLEELGRNCCDFVSLLRSCCLILLFVDAWHICPRSGCTCYCSLSCSVSPSLLLSLSISISSTLTRKTIN